MFKGTDFLGTITVQPNPTTGQRILRVFPLSPSLFPGTRITQLSQLWERYRFVSFTIRYVPAVPTTLACQLICYVDTDPLDDPNSAIDADVLIRQAAAHAGAQQWNFNTPKSILMPFRSDDQLYYTGDTKLNERLNLMGKAYLIQVTDPLNFNGDALTDPVIAGSIYIDWSCKFQLAQINPAGYGLRNSAQSLVIWTTPTTSGERIRGVASGFTPNKKFVGFLGGSNGPPDMIPTGSAPDIVIWNDTELREDPAIVLPSNRLVISWPTQASGLEGLSITDVCTFTSNEKGEIHYVFYMVNSWTLSPTGAAPEVSVREIS